MGEVFAFECGVVGHPATRTVNHRNAGKAKAAYFRDVRDCWPDIRLIDLYAHKVGGPVTPAGFEKTASYRGMPGLRCGQRVLFKSGGVEARGAVVGSNESANFNVLFDDDTCFAGLVLNVHPGEMTVIG